MVLAPPAATARAAAASAAPTDGGDVLAVADPGGPDGPDLGGAPFSRGVVPAAPPDPLADGFSEPLEESFEGSDAAPELFDEGGSMVGRRSSVA